MQIILSIDLICRYFARHFLNGQKHRREKKTNRTSEWRNVRLYFDKQHYVKQFKNECKWREFQIEIKCNKARRTEHIFKYSRTSNTRSIWNMNKMIMLYRFLCTCSCLKTTVFIVSQFIGVRMHFWIYPWLTLSLATSLSWIRHSWLFIFFGCSIPPS